MSQAYAEEVKAARQIVRGNLVKETMMAGKFAASYGLRLAFSTEMPLIIKRSGYQACLMNLEHMAIGMETMKDVSVSCMNVGITPCVVVPTCASEWISRCLDSAAQVIIIPHVDNAEMAQAAVNAGKFPPMGKRSVTMVTAITQYSSNFGYQAIAEVVNDSVMVMPMIESPEGLKNAEAIAAVPGIDCLFIGCADLCMELGIPQQYESDTFNKAVETVAKACEKASVNGRKVFVGLGGLEPRPDLIETFALKYPTVRFAMAGRDIGTLMAGMANQAKTFNAISDKL